MKQINDYECCECGKQWEDYCERDDTPLCVACYSTNVRRLIPTPYLGGESPYKTLEKGKVPDPKRIYSGPHAHSKTR